MDKFRKEYGRAVDGLPEFHMDAGKIQDELHHRRMRRAYRNRLAVKGCTAAAALVLLCGAGTAAAKNYGGGVIEIQDNGYTVTASGMQKGNGNSLAARGRSVAEDYGVEAVSEDGMEAQVMEAEVIEEREFGSLQEFLKDPAAERIPDISLLAGEFQEESVGLLENGMILCVRVSEEGKFFMLNQFDHRDCDGFSSSTGYSGQTANRRNYTNFQGLNYIVFDTIGEDGRIESTHAVISVEGRELSLDFSGFEAESVERLLSELDLTVYFSE